MILKRYLTHQLVLAVMLVAFLSRVPVWITYSPLYGNDTGPYEQLGRMILRGDFAGYDGLRAPGYPLLLLSCGFSRYVLWAVQSLMGILSVAFVLIIAMRNGIGWLIAVLLAVVLATAVNIIFFEAILQTETLSLFLVLVVFIFLQSALVRSATPVPSLLAAGVATGCLCLVRPLYAFMPLMLGALVLHFFCRAGTRFNLALRRAMAYLIPGLMMVLGWSAFNSANVGSFGITTQAGYNLLNHSGQFIEYAPDTYATIRDIYVKHREARRKDVMDAGDNRAFYQGSAIPEMQEATGLGTAELSAVLTQMSLGLFREHPSMYARSVLEAWLRFWRVPIILYPELVCSPRVYTLFMKMWLPVKALWLMLNMSFLGVAIWIIRRMWRPESPAVFVTGCMACTVIVSSVVQALMEFGDNSRYAIPTEPLVLLVVAYAVSLMLDDHSQHRLMRLKGNGCS